MARNAMLTSEVLVLILYRLYMVIEGHGCLSNSGDLNSLVGHFPIVLQGRIVRTRPSTFQPENSQLLDAVVDVETVFKGQVDEGSRIAVGPFGASESTKECVGAARSVGEELVLFLNASGHVSARVGGLPRFRLMANPRSADEESSGMAVDDESSGMVVEEEMSSHYPSHSRPCAETGYCLHGGICYFMRELRRRYCECPDKYAGSRCESISEFWIAREVYAAGR